MARETDPISASKYAAVAQLLRDEPGLSPEDVAAHCGVSVTTVKRIWTGAISRPIVILLDRVHPPRRCSNCGSLCSAWPCITCELQRRQSDGMVAPRFEYRCQPK